MNALMLALSLVAPAGAPGGGDLANAILLEDGSPLLLEDGTPFLLE